MKRKKIIMMLVASMSLTALAAAPIKAPNRVQTLDKVTALPATQISPTAFTANWQPVDGAEAYCVFVYNRVTVPSDGDYAILVEDFSTIDQGSVIEPAGGEDVYVDLSEINWSDTYGWSAYGFPNFIPSMVAGLVYSPYMDLRNNDGNYKIVVKAYASEGDTIRLESHGAGDKITIKYVAHVPDQFQGLSQDTISLSNGIKDTFFSVINETAEVGQADYFDGFEVLQTLKKDDVVNIMVASNETIDAEDDYGNQVTSCRFASLPYKGDATVLWYDIYAVMHDWNTPNDSMPYTTVYSPFSNMVRVDLINRTSEVEPDDEPSAVTTINAAPVSSQAFNIMGQPVDDNYKGIVIVNGKKLIRH